MENLYKELRSFFVNDIDVNDLFDSEAIIWIDWCEDDEDVVRYFNDMMDELSTFKPLAMASYMVTILCYKRAIMNS
ncbi:hypothetical protein [Veillonella rogosae]|uniref:hypothetical protein n=1 Tax=Veillonella rogosae TaxID=423477 RepID=UPI000AEB6433|nr:hypothetical protein [Veillonella rogosae]